MWFPDLTYFGRRLTVICVLWTIIAAAADAPLPSGMGHLPDLEFHDVLTRDAIPGWEIRNGPMDSWFVRDGVLMCNGAGKLWGSWIGTREDYTDFIIDFDYKVSPGANSGLMVRVPKVGHPASVGLEVQILDDEAEKHKNLKPNQLNGSLYKLVAPSKKVTRPAGQWNHMRVVADADRVVVEVNGERVIDADGRSCPELLKRSPRGPIGLQNHHSEVSFRNIRLADLARERAERMKWWQEARFGMFICWGPVTLKGAEIGWSRGGERPGVGGTGEIPVGVYDNLYKQFNPKAFDADAWMALAKAAGARYIVFLTRHHDGFSLFDSKLSDYTIMRSPLHRDVTAEIAAACHRAGLHLGFYYSQPDWHHPDYFTPNHQRYVEYLHGQVRELLTNYGKVDVLWFDGLGAPAEKWDADRLFDMARALQPGIIINNRAGVPGDFDTPEQWIGSSQRGRPWETCMTVGDQWTWKPDDHYKSAVECIHVLIRTAGGGGNLLLNNASMADGRVDPTQADRFRAIGEWLERHGESVYGTQGGPFEPDAWGVSTCRGRVVYLHVLAWEGDQVTLATLQRKILKAALLEGEPVTLEQNDAGIEVMVPRARQEATDTVVRLEMEGLVDGASVAARASGSLAYKHATTRPGETVGRAHGPSEAVDDDYGTFWRGGHAAPEKLAQNPARIEVDLGQPTRIERVRLCEILARIRAFRVECRSEASQAWRVLGEGDRVGPCRVLRFEPLTTRYVRLSVSKVEGSGGFQLAEFQVFASTER